MILNEVTLILVIQFIHLLFMYCVCVLCVCMYRQAGHSMCVGVREQILRNLLFPSAYGDYGVELGLLDLAASAFLC